MGVFQDRRDPDLSILIFLVPQLTWSLRGSGTGHEGTCIAGEQNRGKAYGEDREIKGKGIIAADEGCLQRQLLISQLLLG